MELNILTARNDRQKHEFRFVFQPDATYFENRTFDEAEMTGEYERVGESDDFFLTYRIRYVMRGACDACGEPAAVSGEFEGAERVKKSDGQEFRPREDSMIDEEDDSYVYEGDTIDLDRIANEALLLNLPSKLLCREDCRGLCPKCGKNLNEGDCDCSEDYSDSPFAKLLNLNKN